MIVQYEYCSNSSCSISTCSNRFLGKRHSSKDHVQIIIVQLTWKAGRHLRVGRDGRDRGPCGHIARPLIVISFLIVIARFHLTGRKRGKECPPPTTIVVSTLSPDLSLHPSWKESERRNHPPAARHDTKCWEKQFIRGFC